MQSPPPAPVADCAPGVTTSHNFTQQPSGHVTPLAGRFDQSHVTETRGGDGGFLLSQGLPLAGGFHSRAARHAYAEGGKGGPPSGYLLARFPETARFSLLLPHSRERTSVPWVWGPAVEKGGIPSLTTCPLPRLFRSAPCSLTTPCHLPGAPPPPPPGPSPSCGPPLCADCALAMAWSVCVRMQVAGFTW